MVDQKKENVATTREGAKTKSEVKILLKEERRQPSCHHFLSSSSWPL